MGSMTSGDLGLALGLVGIFLAVFLGFSMFNNFVMEPMRRRRH